MRGKNMFRKVHRHHVATDQLSAYQVWAVDYSVNEISIITKDQMEQCLRKACFNRSPLTPGGK